MGSDGASVTIVEDEQLRYVGGAGSAKSMLLHMVEHTDLSEADIEEIRRSLSEKKRDGRKQKNRKRS